MRSLAGGAGTFTRGRGRNGDGGALTLTRLPRSPGGEEPLPVQPSNPKSAQLLTIYDPAKGPIPDSFFSDILGDYSPFAHEHVGECSPGDLS